MNARTRVCGGAPQLLMLAALAIARLVEASAIGGMLPVTAPLATVGLGFVPASVRAR